MTVSSVLGGFGVCEEEDGGRQDEDGDDERDDDDDDDGAASVIQCGMLITEMSKEVRA